jgi:hypothetical protein
VTRGLVFVALMLGLPGAWANDASGLDLTIDVLGRNDSIDERIVNRIAIPGVAMDRAPGERHPLAAVGGVLGGVGGVVGGVVERVAPALPLLRYEEWVEQRKEAEQDRRRDARERARERRE